MKATTQIKKEMQDLFEKFEKEMKALGDAYDKAYKEEIKNKIEGLVKNGVN